MDSLPALCLDIIARHIYKDTFDDDELPTDIAKIAASCIIANKKFENIAFALYDFLDPGCVECARTKHAKEMQRYETYDGEAELQKLGSPPTYDLVCGGLGAHNKIPDIKAFCKSHKLSQSGNKQTLLARINEYFAQVASEYQANMEKVRKKHSTPPQPTWCPVRSAKREEIRSLKTKKITATTAMKEFRLKDSDLDALYCERKINPHYRCAPMMRLYLYIDVFKLSKQKRQGSLRGAKEAAEATAAKRAATRNANKMQRTNDLNAALALHFVGVPEITNYSDAASEIFDAYVKSGKHLQDTVHQIVNIWLRYNDLKDALSARQMTLRSDSRVCADYVNGASHYSLSHVCEIMYEMKFLFAYTPYNSIRERLVREYANEERRYEGFVDWADVNQRASDRAKRLAIQAWSKTIENPRAFLGLPTRFMGWVP